MFDLDKFMSNKKRMNVIYIILILIVVVMTALSFIPTTPDEQKQPEPKYNVTVLEERLAAMLEQVPGVEKVKVMLTIESGDELVIASEDKQTQNGTSDKEGGKTESISVESRPVLRNSGGGQAPVVLKEVYPRVRGAMVTATGDDNPVVKETIMQAVMAVLSIKANNVYVVLRR